jgi:hypothetical protein
MLSRLLLLAALALVSLSSSVHGQAKTLQEGQELDSEMYQSLPNFEDKGVMQRIRCGACQSSVLEIAYGILRRENDANRAVSEIEVRFPLSAGLPARSCCPAITFLELCWVPNRSC